MSDAHELEIDAIVDINREHFDVAAGETRSLKTDMETDGLDVVFEAEVSHLDENGDIEIIAENYTAVDFAELDFANTDVFEGEPGFEADGIKVELSPEFESGSDADGDETAAKAEIETEIEIEVDGDCFEIELAEPKTTVGTLETDQLTVEATAELAHVGEE
ncbi:hypothetical protein [Halomicrobium katesii]|uniref:hypothetical protein n=1 Tax=Halomicrobium katesii TaxID=437163 RepID=UPI00037090ED|nr:hypothetical protein [Halomicrobium katesii]